MGTHAGQGRSHGGEGHAHPVLPQAQLHGRGGQQVAQGRGVHGTPPRRRLPRGRRPLLGSLCSRGQHGQGRPRRPLYVTSPYPAPQKEAGCSIPDTPPAEGGVAAGPTFLDGPGGLGWAVAAGWQGGHCGPRRLLQHPRAGVDPGGSHIPRPRHALCGVGGAPAPPFSAASTVPPDRTCLPGDSAGLCSAVPSPQGQRDSMPNLTLTSCRSFQSRVRTGGQMGTGVSTPQQRPKGGFGAGGDTLTTAGDELRGHQG